MAEQVNRLAFADFYNGSQINQTKSDLAGRPIHDDVEMIRIRWAGNTKNEFHAPANDRSDRPVVDAGTNTKYWPKWKEHPDFLAAYEAFKRGQSIIGDGTPLEEWTTLTTAKRAELKAINIFTVDQLANLDPAAMKRLGVEGLKLKEQAQLFLQRAAGAAVDAQHTQEREAMQRQIDDLRALVEGKAAAPTPAPVKATRAKAGQEAAATQPKTVSPFETWEDGDIRTWIEDALKSDPSAERPHHKLGHDKLVEFADALNTRLQAAKKQAVAA